MKKIRLNTDFVIEWRSILINGAPANFNELSPLLFLVVDPLGQAHAYKPTFIDDGHSLSVRIKAADLTVQGVYSLTVYIHHGETGQTAIDRCEAFALTPSLCCPPNTPSSLEHVVVMGGDVAVGVKGLSAYEIALKNGFKGSEEEWLQSLQQPATDAADNANQIMAEFQQKETAIIEAEQARIKAEQQRNTAEAQRIEDEASRTEAEQARTTAEQQRNTAEAQRIEAENSRSEAETQRATAEQLRAEADHARSEAEQTRTEAEQQRNTAEAQRIGAEISRTEAEVQRAAAEQQRAEAEQSRVAAEANRQQQTTAAIEAAKTATASATSATAEAEKAVTAATNATTEASEAAKLATDAASKTSTVDYAVCTTAATIADKEINIAGFALGTHCRFLVKMSHIAETEDVKLSVRSGDTLTEPKPLTFNGAPASVNNTWRAGDILDVYYDGSSFHATHYMGGYGITEINVSEMCPKGGHNGTNKYTLAEAIKKIPEAHQRVGFKCSFINDNGEIETAVYQGGTWENIKSWKRGESGEITTKYDRLCWMNAHGQKLPLWPQTTLWSLEFQFAQESNYLMLNTLDDATKMGIKIQIGYVSQAITYYLNGELKTVQLYQFESLNHTVISYDGYTLRVYYSGVLQAEDLLGSSYDFRFPEKFTAKSTAPFAFLRTYNYPITEDIFRGGACRLEPLDWSRRNAEPEILSFSVKGVQPELSKITFPCNSSWQNDFVTYNGNRVNMNAKGKSLTTLIAHITTTKESFLVHYLTNNPCLLIGYNNGRPLEKVSNGIKLKPGENTVISVGFSYSDYKITSESAETEECIMYVDCITSGCVRNYDVINADKEYIYDDCMGKKYKCKSIPSRNSLASSVVYGPNQPKYPYFVGQIWINPTNESSYICVAIMKKLWKKITS